MVLDTGSFWRIRTVWETVKVVRSSGQVEYVGFVYDKEWFRKHEGKIEPDNSQWSRRKAMMLRTGHLLQYAHWKSD